LDLCLLCYNSYLENGKSISSNFKEQNQICLQDQTAADSEVDQAEEDTRCQSSLMTKQRNQNAPSSVFNEDNQINSFQH
jgi:hypothetical protein